MHVNYGIINATNTWPPASYNGHPKAGLLGLGLEAKFSGLGLGLEALGLGL